MGRVAAGLYLYLFVQPTARHHLYLLGLHDWLAGLLGEGGLLARGGAGLALLKVSLGLFLSVFHWFFGPFLLGLYLFLHLLLLLVASLSFCSLEDLHFLQVCPVLQFIQQDVGVVSHLRVRDKREQIIDLLGGVEGRQMRVEVFNDL